MFNFTTQTVFNSIVPATEAEVRAKTATKGYNLIVGGDGSNPTLRIGNTRFNASNIIDIQMKKHTPEHLAKVAFDMAKIAGTAGDYRIALYLGLSMNSQDSFYANDYTYKGKPLYVEFAVAAADTAAAIATKIVKISNKYMLFVAQDKILDVTATEGKVTFAGVNGYQVIKKAALQKFDTDAQDYVDVITGAPVTYTATNGVVAVTSKVLDFDGLRDLAATEVAIEPGLEAFGDYNWIIHNLRLPTLANTYYWAVTKSEMPVVGGEYTQFIIRIKAERDGIAGSIVGERATSVTTHVLYVLDSGTNVSKVQTELAKLGTIKTDADTALAKPYPEAAEAAEAADSTSVGN